VRTVGLWLLLQALQVQVHRGGGGIGGSHRPARTAYGPVRKRNGKCRTYVAGSAAFLKHWSSGAIQVYFASDNEVF